MGEIISPIVTSICIIMSRRKTKSRVFRANGSCGASSRPNRLLDVPLWLILYWLDLAITTSGYFSRRRVLRLRNDLLTFLKAPSGDLWYVGVHPKTKEN